MARLAAGVGRITKDLLPAGRVDVGVRRGRRRRDVRHAVAAIALAGVALGLAVAPATASVYWGTYLGNLGRANLDGSGATPNLLAPRGLQNVCGVAVDRNWIYFAEKPANKLGRATLDGTLLSEDFITGLTNPCGVAVDAQHVYWADTHFADATGTIGRANLDGSGRNDNFITGLNQPCAVALDAAHVYWSSCGANDGFGTGSTIGRANVDGSGVNDAFITGAAGTAGVAVDASHIYWTNNTLGTIGRADLTGANVNQNFIQASPGPAAGPGGPSTLGLAAGQGFLFWDEGQGLPMGGWAAFIGRATVAGSNAQQNLIVADSIARGVAVDAFTPSTATLTTSPESVLYGQDVELHAHVGAVSPPAGVPAQPTGQVSLTLDGTQVPASAVPLDASGDARLHPPFLLDAGTHFAIADYAGDASYATSHAGAQLTVDPAATQTTMQVTPNPATIGSSFDVTVGVTNTSTDVVPFGSVEFFVDGASLGSLDLDDNGKVDAQVTTQPGIVTPGQYQLVVRYSDTTGTPPDFVPSSAQTTVTLTAPPNAAPPAEPGSQASLVPPVSGPTPSTPSTPRRPAAFTLLAPKAKRGAITLRVLAPSAGLFTARATTRTGFTARTRGFTIRTAPGRYGSARARARHAGPLTFVIKPTRAAKSALARGITLHLKLTVTFTPANGSAPTSVTRRLTIKGTNRRRR